MHERHLVAVEEQVAQGAVQAVQVPDIFVYPVSHEV